MYAIRSYYDVETKPDDAMTRGDIMTLSFSFGTVGSPIGTPKKPGGSVGAIEFSKSIGLTAFELGWVQSVRVTEATCADIKRTGKEQGVGLSVHASYFFNLNATEEEWPKSRKRRITSYNVCYTKLLRQVTGK